MCLRAPLESGTNASLFHSPMNLSGLNVYGSSQYRPTQVFVNPPIRPADEAVLTIIMNSGDADADHGPSRDRDVVVSPVSFPTLRVVSSALYFGVKAARDNRQRRSVAVPKSFKPQLTTGNILNVSYIVLHR